jgi:exonuclease III
MLQPYRIATLNVNGITSRVKLAMLADVVTRQDMDILLLQEVATPNFIMPMGYSVYHNLGSTGSGTAIIIRSQLELRKMLRLPSGRGFAAELQGLWIVNIYAPSGAERRREREDFSI